MADRFWVGDGGDWSDNLNHWSAADGGAPNASLPTSSDNVYFTANSFTIPAQTVTIDATANCLDIDWTGALNTPTLTFTTGVILGIYGNCTFINAMVIPTSVITFIVFYGNANHSLTTNGVTINAQYVGSYSGTGTLTLLDDLNCRTLLLREGVLNTNGKTVTGNTFYSSYTFVRGLFLGGSTLNFSLIYGWDCSDSTNLTLNAGTSTINLNLSSSGTFAGGGQVYNIVNLNGPKYTVSGNNTFAQLNLPAATTQTITVTAGSIQTITSATLSGDATHTHTIVSGTAGTLAQIWATNKTDDYVTYTDILRNYNGVIVADCSGTVGGTFAGAGGSFTSLTVQGSGNYPLTISGSNTITGVTHIDASTSEKTIKFTDGTTTAVGGMTRDAGRNWITLTGTGTAGWNIVKSGAGDVNLHRMKIYYSAAS